ncbi:conserved hypothetical protein [Neospora caninum Liverpool]|uniref:IgA-specific metalloendopeptidase n=1 Tax=Neospora caninum (strain Liverpool) TaxID=572307 RepID=F0VLP6_NEOCL|nr:conserved hypothetical protein [Neospora caninum Liverpool]CBZ54174.1 conserved hypothetical protein [Neospora caninum Liverpool]|eukprot:XP_003884205.1 conserved hypothetical protein [Neospora caninum Liverpool]
MAGTRGRGEMVGVDASVGEEEGDRGDAILRSLPRAPANAPEEGYEVECVDECPYIKFQHASKLSIAPLLNASSSSAASLPAPLRAGRCTDSLCLLHCCGVLLLPGLDSLVAVDATEAACGTLISRGRLPLRASGEDHAEKGAFPSLLLLSPDARLLAVAVGHQLKLVQIGVCRHATAAKKGCGNSVEKSEDVGAGEKQKPCCIFEEADVLTLARFPSPVKDISWFSAPAGEGHATHTVGEGERGETEALVGLAVLTANGEAFLLSPNAARAVPLPAHGLAIQALPTGLGDAEKGQDGRWGHAPLTAVVSCCAPASLWLVGLQGSEAPLPGGSGEHGDQLYDFGDGKERQETVKGAARQGTRRIRIEGLAAIPGYEDEAQALQKGLGRIVGVHLLASSAPDAADVEGPLPLAVAWFAPDAELSVGDDEWEKPEVARDSLVEPRADPLQEVRDADCEESWSSFLFFGFLFRRAGALEGGDAKAGRGEPANEAGDADAVCFHIYAASRNELFLRSVTASTLCRFLWIPTWQCLWVFTNACTQIICFALPHVFSRTPSSTLPAPRASSLVGSDALTWRCFTMPEGRGLETADEDAFPQGLALFVDFQEKMFREQATTDTPPLEHPPVFFLLQSDGQVCVHLADCCECYVDDEGVGQEKRLLPRLGWTPASPPSSSLLTAWREARRRTRERTESSATTATALPPIAASSQAPLASPLFASLQQGQPTPSLFGTPDTSASSGPSLFSSSSGPSLFSSSSGPSLFSSSSGPSLFSPSSAPSLFSSSSSASPSSLFTAVKNQGETRKASSLFPSEDPKPVPPGSSAQSSSSQSSASASNSRHHHGAKSAPAAKPSREKGERKNDPARAELQRTAHANPAGTVSQKKGSSCMHCGAEAGGRGGTRDAERRRENREEEKRRRRENREEEKRRRREKREEEKRRRREETKSTSLDQAAKSTSEIAQATLQAALGSKGGKGEREKTRRRISWTQEQSEMMHLLDEFDEKKGAFCSFARFLPSSLFRPLLLSARCFETALRNEERRDVLRDSSSSSAALASLLAGREGDAKPSEGRPKEHRGLFLLPIAAERLVCTGKMTNKLGAEQAKMREKQDQETQLVAKLQAAQQHLVAWRSCLEAVRGHLLLRMQAGECRRETREGDGANGETANGEPGNEKQVTEKQVVASIQTLQRESAERETLFLALRTLLTEPHNGGESTNTTDPEHTVTRLEAALVRAERRLLLLLQRFRFYGSCQPRRASALRTDSGNPLEHRPALPAPVPSPDSREGSSSLASADFSDRPLSASRCRAEVAEERSNRGSVVEAAAQSFGRAKRPGSSFGLRFDLLEDETRDKRQDGEESSSARLLAPGSCPSSPFPAVSRSSASESAAEVDGRASPRKDQSQAAVSPPSAFHLSLFGSAPPRCAATVRRSHFPLGAGEAGVYRLLGREGEFLGTHAETPHAAGLANELQRSISTFLSSVRQLETALAKLEWRATDLQSPPRASAPASSAPSSSHVSFAASLDRLASSLAETPTRTGGATVDAQAIAETGKHDCMQRSVGRDRDERENLISASSLREQTLRREERRRMRMQLLEEWRATSSADQDEEETEEDTEEEEASEEEEEEEQEDEEESAAFEILEESSSVTYNEEEEDSDDSWEPASPRLA